MPENSNLESARAGYEAFAQVNMATLNDLIAADIVWHFPGHNILFGHYVGKEAVFGMFARLAQETGGTFKNEVQLSNCRHNTLESVLSRTYVRCHGVDGNHRKPGRDPDGGDRHYHQRRARPLL
jgi:ketosteroid isomerase-like protein